MKILEKYLVKSPETASRIIEGEAVVVLPKISQVSTFNEVATRIWQLCDGNKKTSEIIDQIEDEFDAETQQIKTDCLAFITQLVEQHMLLASDKKMSSYD